MSIAMLIMLYKHNLDKLKASMPGTKEFAEYLKNCQEYDAILREIEANLPRFHKGGTC